MKNAEDGEQETIFMAVLFVLLIQQEPQSSQESRKMVMYIPAAWLHQDSLALVAKVWHEIHFTNQVKGHGRSCTMQHVYIEGTACADRPARYVAATEQLLRAWF